MKVKKINDYYEELYKLYPDVPKSDIKKILNYGWRLLYLHNSYGGDTLVRDKNFWCYIGALSNNGLTHFKYYINKLCLKMRILYRRHKVKWDGYYYFAVTDDVYENYIKKIGKKKNTKRKINFGPVMMFQILDDCKIQNSGYKYIFRIPYISEISLQFFVPELITNKAELIITRQPLKFKDILVENNNYELL